MHWFRHPDLMGIDDLKPASFVVQQHGLPIGTHHQVISMRDDERLAVSEHNPNWAERLRLHQFFDLINDHRSELRHAVLATQGRSRWKQPARGKS
jgi:hypothetical protein